MSVISLAVIGKNRQPIYMKEFTSDHHDSSSSSSRKNIDDDLQLFGISSSSSYTTNVLKENQLNTDTNLHHHHHSNENSRCDCSIRQQFILHDALDFMEQWIEQHQNSHEQQQQQNAHDAMFAGLLYPIEDMRVYGTCAGSFVIMFLHLCFSCLKIICIISLSFLCLTFLFYFVGYMTTTQVILLVVVQDTVYTGSSSTAIDESIQRLCITLHRYYVEYILNPFTPITTSTKMIESQQFHTKVQQYIDSYNHHNNSQATAR
jgi:hypothetical protein